MSSGQAPLLMLDLATSHIRDRQRAMRGLAPRRASRRTTWRARARAQRAAR